MPRVKTILKHLDGPWSAHSDTLDIVLAELRLPLAQRYLASVMVHWTFRPRPLEITLERICKVLRISARQANRLLTGIEERIGAMLVYRWHGKPPKIFVAPLIEACDLAARAIKDKLGWLTGRIQEIGQRFGMTPRAYNELCTAVQEMQISAGWSNEQLSDAMGRAADRVGHARARTPWGLWRHFLQEAVQEAVRAAAADRAWAAELANGAETDEQQPQEAAGAERAPQEAAGQTADAAPAAGDQPGGPASARDAAPAASDHPGRSSALPANDGDIPGETQEHPVLAAARKRRWATPPCGQGLPSGRRDIFGKPILWRPADERNWRRYVEVASVDAQRIALDILAGKSPGLVKLDIERLLRRGA